MLEELVREMSPMLEVILADFLDVLLLGDGSSTVQISEMICNDLLNFACCGGLATPRLLQDR